MSIIEETLQRLQRKQDTDAPKADKSELTSTGTVNMESRKKGRSRKFISVVIVLTLITFAAYFWIDMYQKRIQERNKNVFSDQVAFLLIKKTKTSHENDALSKPVGIAVLSKEDEFIMEEKDHGGIIVLPESQEINESQGIDESEDERFKSQPEQPVAQPALVAENSEEVIAGTRVGNEDLIIEPPAPDSGSKTNETLGKNIVSKTPLSIDKQPLTHAKNLINIGSYEKAIDILKPGIEGDVGTWELYFLMGSAYLGLGNLDLAEQFLDRGIAINGNQLQLWIQRAVLEQQRGNHETALQILHEAEQLDPTMPEIQLNMGYSSDALGNRNSITVKAYRYFLELTEGDPAYLTVRQKVLDRLVRLVVIK